MKQTSKERIASHQGDQAVRDHALPLLLIENHARFLAFIRRRVEVPEVAEDILQAAYMRALQGDRNVDPGHERPWFYRVLRNAVIDHYRHNAARPRTVELEEASREIVADTLDSQNVCPCASKELTRLRADYTVALAELDMGTAKVGEYAARAGISSNNASVCLHRARKALRSRLEDLWAVCGRRLLRLHLLLIMRAEVVVRV